MWLAFLPLDFYGREVSRDGGGGTMNAYNVRMTQGDLMTSLPPPLYLVLSVCNGYLEPYTTPSLIDNIFVDWFKTKTKYSSVLKYHMESKRGLSANTWHMRKNFVGGGSTVDYFQQFCAISKVLMVLIIENIYYYHIIGFIKICLPIFVQIYFEYVSFKFKIDQNCTI